MTQFKIQTTERRNERNWRGFLSTDWFWFSLSRSKRWLSVNLFPSILFAIPCDETNSWWSGKPVESYDWKTSRLCRENFTLTFHDMPGRYWPRRRSSSGPVSLSVRVPDVLSDPGESGAGLGKSSSFSPCWSGWITENTLLPRFPFSIHCKWNTVSLILEGKWFCINLRISHKAQLVVPFWA